MSQNSIDISKYLQYLTDAGWSDLIDDRWKEQVKTELIARFPDMTAEEWSEVEGVVFI